MIWVPKYLTSLTREVMIMLREIVHESSRSRFGHLSTKITKISKHYYSLKNYSFSNLKTESYKGCESTTFGKTEFLVHSSVVCNSTFMMNRFD